MAPARASPLSFNMRSSFAFAAGLLIVSCSALREPTPTPTMRFVRKRAIADTRRPALSSELRDTALPRCQLLASGSGVAKPVADDVIPGRSVVLASSVTFIVASLLLVAEFAAIYCGAFSIVNYLGAASSVGWVVGFVLLINWIVFSTFSVWGFDKRALTGAIIKLVAATFFNIQPWSWIIAPGYGVPGIGVPWSNFVGAWMFHVGNTIDAVGMAAMYDRSTPFALANWPVLGMWVLTAASTCLSIAGTISFFNIPVGLQYVVPSQIFGAVLLFVGSVMYTYWSVVFGKQAAS